MNQYIFIYVISIIALTMFSLYVYHRNSSFNRKIALSQHNHDVTMDKAKFELETIKVNNAHAETLQKINEDRFKDERDHAVSQHDKERAFYLKQKEIDAINGKNVLDAIMPIVVQQNEHHQRMAEIRGTITNVFENKGKE